MMESIHFEPGRLPLYISQESLRTHQVHSPIPHVHGDIELISVLKGSVQCQTGSSVFELHKGDVCFINRGQLHALYEEPGQEDEQRVLLVGTQLLKGIPGIFDRYIRGFLEDIRFSHVRFEGSDSPAGAISRSMDRMEQLMKEEPQGFELELLSHLFEILSYLYQAYVQGPSLSAPDAGELTQKTLTAFIYEHYSEPLTLDDIASAGHVSRSHCARLFKQFTRLSPMQFLNRHRLEISCELLRQSPDSIAQIAKNCGFKDQGYFNRLFHRSYGCTPSEYRKLKRLDP